MKLLTDESLARAILYLKPTLIKVTSGDVPSTGNMAFAVAMTQKGHEMTFRLPRT